VSEVRSIARVDDIEIERRDRCTADHRRYAPTTISSTSCRAKISRASLNRGGLFTAQLAAAIDESLQHGQPFLGREAQHLPDIGPENGT
jgi:hypothetical protein